MHNQANQHQLLRNRGSLYAPLFLPQKLLRCVWSPLAGVSSPAEWRLAQNTLIKCT